MSGAISNFIMKSIINSPLHPLLGDSFAVITVTGRKSGQPYSTPINAIKDGDGFTVLSQRERTWWRNLRGGRPASLRLAGHDLRVTGQVLESPGEVAAFLEGYLQRHPAYAKYFRLELGPDGRPEPEAVERAAEGRVVVRFQPVDSR